ncbi:hypothetical protein BDU57DRAFT_553490 [Ampelomyces quisqualis]|uniref:Uncharacterized protein n=1 Tax=Ampelomyces quisqualis TaxID=50730 RepID=A0A6A5R0V8_AMPQU|nr:hypothetical protein BDU57DRAFT_553490 [Ampelomyces quisqualis]
MHFSTFIATIAAITGLAQADFMVYTVPPIPTDSIPKFTDPAQASGWTLSVFINGNRAYNSFTKALGSTYQSSRSSAASEIAAFARSASNYSIPADVTNDETTTTFFSRPDWYTALPSGARAFKEQQVSDQFSIVRSVIAARATTASSTAAALPTAHAFLDAKFGAMAAVAAGVFL